MSNRAIEAVITAAVGLAVVVLLRWILVRSFDRLERRLNARDPGGAARRHTTLAFLRKVIVAVAVMIAAWQVLSLYPQTDRVVGAMLASGAVIALFVGIAFNTPLSNLGAGILVAFAQPLRLGDRVTVLGETGFVEQMSLLYTTLVTDDGRRIFIPNSQVTNTTIVNRTIHDPRRAVAASFPIGLGSSVTSARDAVTEALASLPGLLPDPPLVVVGDIQGGAVSLEVTAYAALDANVAQLGSDLREKVLVALGKRELLPS